MFTFFSLGLDPDHRFVLNVEDTRKSRQNYLNLVVQSDPQDKSYDIVLQEDDDLQHRKYFGMG